MPFLDQLFSSVADVLFYTKHGFFLEIIFPSGKNLPPSNILSSARVPVSHVDY